MRIARYKPADLALGLSLALVLVAAPRARAEGTGEIRVVVLDVTDRKSTAAANAEARRLGIEEIFDRYRSNTGTVLVVRGSNRELVKVLKGQIDPASYRPAIADARES
jgi:hypothetical protein